MFRQMKIQTLLSWGFGVLIALTSIMAAIVLQRATVINGHVVDIVADATPKAVAATEIRLNVLRNWANTLLLLHVSADGEVKRITDEMTANSKIITDRFETLEKRVSSGKGKELLAAMIGARKDYTESRKQYLEMIKGGDKGNADAFLGGTLRPKLDTYINAISALVGHQASKVEKLNGENQDLTSSLKTVTSILSFTVVGLAIAAAVVIIRTVSAALGGDVHYVGGIARQIAAGNLSIAVHAAPGDTTSLVASIKTMRDRLRDVVAGIETSANQLGKAAHGLAQESGAVADASVKQSEATVATAAAVEEMTVSIGQIADSAKEAQTLSLHSEELSRNGRTVIDGATAEMQKIADSVDGSATIIATLETQSNEISAIVNVIKEIADQTNLLALNAAIEAARAGEQGRGFAVVADEVRKLAERTTASTQEIAATIAKIQGGTRDAVQSMVSGVEQVKSGTALAEQAGTSIVEIESEAQQVVLVVNNITSSLNEQSAASNEIARNIESIAAMVEENNAAAARAAEAARQLEQLADGLTRTIGVFQT